MQKAVRCWVAVYLWQVPTKEVWTSKRRWSHLQLFPPLQNREAQPVGHPHVVRQHAAEMPLDHGLRSGQRCETLLLAQKVDFLANCETCHQMAAADLGSFAPVGKGKAGREGFSQTSPDDTWSLSPGTRVPSRGGKCLLFWLLSLLAVKLLIKLWPSL